MEETWFIYVYDHTYGFVEESQNQTKSLHVM